MAATPLRVLTRPFSIEPLTGVMMTDGIFDNALFHQRIACHVTNTGSQDLKNVTVYLESVGDPGIEVTGQTYTFERIPRGAAVLVSWAADFEHARPGKPLVSFVARADGFTPARSIRQIFVSQTRYDSVQDVFTCTVPEGTLVVSDMTVIPCAPGAGWPSESGSEGKPPWIGPGVLTGATLVWIPGPPYAGTHGELPFADPAVKILLAIIAGVLLAAGIIVAANGHGSVHLTFVGQLEFKADPDLTISCCFPAKPEPTVLGGRSWAGWLARAALGVGIAALADGEDPHWRGQEATPPAAGELTVSERVVAKWTLPDPPGAGAPYRTDVRWRYERFTTGATYAHEAVEQQTNTHVADHVEVITPATIDAPADGWLWVRAKFVRPGGAPFRGPELYTVALFRSPGGVFFRGELEDNGIGFDTAANDGVYTAAVDVRTLVPDPQGVWQVYVFGQDVNLVAPGTPPHIAARTVGGMVIGSAVEIVFDPSLPCPVRAQAATRVI